MSENKYSTFKFFRSLVFVLIIASLAIFLVTACLSSLFGASLWSWVNVLRFVIGGGIVFLLVVYGFFFKAVLFGGKAK